MKKKRRRKTNYDCDSVLPNFINTDCSDSPPPMQDLNSTLSIYCRMMATGNPWLSTDITGAFIYFNPYTHHAYGYFQRLVVYNNYMFPFDICHGLN